MVAADSPGLDRLGGGNAHPRGVREHFYPDFLVPVRLWRGSPHHKQRSAAVPTALPGARGDRHPARAPVLGGGYLAGVRPDRLAATLAVRWPMERIFRAGLLLWVVAVHGNTLVGAGLVIWRPPLPDPAAAIALYKSGDLAGIFMVRFAEWVEFYGFGLIVLFPLVGAACLLGIAAERWLAGRPPSALVELAPDLRRWLVWPAVVGSIAYGLLAVTPRSVADGALLAPEIILRAVFSPLGALVLLVASIRLFASPASAWLREWFRINGQLSLSIYVGQSIACVLLFHGYGLGLYGSIGLFGSLMAAVALFAAMTLAAWAWQRLFGRGPLERLLVH
jgi:uncharacterized protein